MTISYFDILGNIPERISVEHIAQRMQAATRVPWHEAARYYGPERTVPEISHLLRAVNALSTALSLAQWGRVGHSHAEEMWCASCQKTAKEGHAAACPIGVALVAYGPK